MSFLDLKELTRRFLSSNSVLRGLILSEPDYLPRQEALVKVQIYVKLLYQEIAK